MSTKRAKKHKERSHYGRLVREHINEANKGGAFDKQLNKRQRNPRKFRRRAYYREKELEDEILREKIQQSLKTDPLRLLQSTTAPFEPVWATKEKHNDD